MTDNAAALADTAMIYADIVDRRKSVRAFRPDPVPAALLQQVFAAALRAPSNCNTQPWQTHVASGEPLERLRKRIPDAFMRGEFSMDFPYDGKYEGVYKDRQYAAAEALYSAMGIQREEKDKRNAAFMRNFTFFDAPHVAFLFLPEPFGLREACDLGMYAQTVMLSMVAHGLGCCPQTALSFLAEPVRAELGIDSSNKLLFGISFGYEDTEAAANRCRTDRGSLEEITHFHG
ncbi:MAG: nitroreductase family protein [Halieaceae bacterium]|jgi:nitroreductase|nr:nitroreductase family protein [Halieaceae bacterium]